MKYKRGMRIGDLCAETGHFGWARKVWRFTAMLIESKDYDDPIGAWEDMLEQYQAEQETARIFSEGQGDYFPRMDNYRLTSL